MYNPDLNIPFLVSLMSSVWYRRQGGRRTGKALGRIGTSWHARQLLYSRTTGVRYYGWRTPRGIGHVVPVDLEATQIGEIKSETGQVGQGLGRLHMRLLILSITDGLSTGDAFHNFLFIPPLRLRWGISAETWKERAVITKMRSPSSNSHCRRM